VNAGALLASTLQISLADFLTGRYTFSGGNGAVVNKGTLRAHEGGYIALLAPQVINEGYISAHLLIAQARLREERKLQAAAPLE
jgi:hypothetical protein